MPTDWSNPGWKGAWGGFMGALGQAGHDISLQILAAKQMKKQRAQEVEDLETKHRWELEESARAEERKRDEEARAKVEKMSEIIRGEETAQKKMLFEQSMQTQQDEAALQRAQVMAQAGITKAGMTGAKPENVEPLDKTIADIVAGAQMSPHHIKFIALQNPQLDEAGATQLYEQFKESIPAQDIVSGATRSNYDALYKSVLERIRKARQRGTSGGGLWTPGSTSPKPESQETTGGLSEDEYNQLIHGEGNK